MFSEIGGLQGFVFSFFMVLSNMISHDMNNVEMIKIFRLNDGAIFGSKFRLKSFFIRNFCCGKTKLLDQNFVVDYKKYENYLE